MEHQTRVKLCSPEELGWMPQRYLKYRGINELQALGDRLREPLNLEVP
jgi:hypothetical protein